MSAKKRITCLAVDDEPPALEIIKKYIAAFPALDLIETCINAVEALVVLKAQTIDLLFLDIQMPQILGTDFIRTLRHPPKVIFTTAYRKFAVEGFELDAIDYLLKPISFDRFLKAVNKVMDIDLPIAQHEFVPEHTGTNQKEAFISFRVDRKNIKVSLDDILYVESLKDYVKVVTRTKNIITKQSITSLEESLPSNYFIRIHRSYIVALNKIESYTNELIEIGKQELPISRMYRHEVAKILSPD
jgi:DNA-binding LytR/AlgR family response regulator